MPTTTTNLSLNKPTVGGDTDLWGGYLNTNFDTLDAIFKSDGTGSSVGLNVGTGKSLKVGGSFEASVSQNAKTQIKVNNVNAGASASAGVVLGTSSGDNGYVGANGGAASSALGGANALQITNLTAGPIVFATDTTERARFDSSGNFGIGGTPSAKLHVSSGATDEVARFEGTGSPFVSIYDTNVRQLYIAGTATGSSIVVETNNNLLLSTNNTERVRIDGTGNVTVAKAARGTITTDNDGSFDMNAASNFSCTPSGTFTLTFTNITSGQSGFILLINTGGHSISAAATTKVSATALATISAAGTYLLSYFSNGTNVYVVNSGALS